MKSYSEFHEAALPDIASLSLGGRNDNKVESNIVPTNTPSTLLEWSVLILNTADPALKVYVDKIPNKAFLFIFFFVQFNCIGVKDSTCSESTFEW